MQTERAGLCFINYKTHSSLARWHSVSTLLIARCWKNFHTLHWEWLRRKESEISHFTESDMRLLNAFAARQVVWKSWKTWRAVNASWKFIENARSSRLDDELSPGHTIECALEWFLMVWLICGQYSRNVFAIGMHRRQGLSDSVKSWKVLIQVREWDIRIICLGNGKYVNDWLFLFRRAHFYNYILMVWCRWISINKINTFLIHYSKILHVYTHELYYVFATSWIFCTAHLFTTYKREKTFTKIIECSK